MQRRDFLKYARDAALLLSLPAPFIARHAAARQRGDFFWINVNAGGGWDPTIVMDPKGHDTFNRRYGSADIRETSTGIRYAPKMVGRDYLSGPHGDRTPFFERYKDDLLVINGIDTRTNSHLVGRRHVWSGTLRAGHPNFAALITGIRERNLGRPIPLAMVSTGGYDSTSGLFPVARAANPILVQDVAEPARIYAADSASRFVHSDTDAMIKAAELARRSRRDPERYLPAVRKALLQHWSMRDVEAAFGSLNTEIAQMKSLTEAESANRAISAAQLAIAGMRSGVCYAAMLTVNGFDTHADHDARHHARMQEVFDVIDYVVRTTKEAGLYDRTVITVGSDFARTVYNGPASDTTCGKDHWPITSMMALGGPISGGRTIGLTDNGPAERNAPEHLLGHLASPLVVSGGELIPTTADDPDGFQLEPMHIHKALRQLARIDDDPLGKKFALEASGPTLPIFE